MLIKLTLKAPRRVLDVLLFDLLLNIFGKYEEVWRVYVSCVCDDWLVLYAFDNLQCFNELQWVCDCPRCEFVSNVATPCSPWIVMIFTGDRISAIVCLNATQTRTEMDFNVTSNFFI